MGPIVVELMQAGDITGAADVLARAFHTNPLMARAWGATSVALARQRAWYAYILTRPQPTVLVARRDGRTVGVMEVIRCPQSRPHGIAVLKRAAVMASLMGWRVAVALRWARSWAGREPRTPHWHLGAVGVAPDSQGLAVGSTLVRHFCSFVDGLGGPAYLETDRPENVPFYRRFGFEVVAQEHVIGVPCWYMWRPARARADGTTPGPGTVRPG